MVLINMRVDRLLLTIFALFFAFTILGVSITSASLATNHEQDSLSNRQFYLNQEILPDHIFYPLLMLQDKAKLALASEDEQIYLRVELAWRRLTSAKELIKKGEKALAITTITKSQKYLNYAILELLGKSEFSDTIYYFMLNNTEAHSHEIEALLDRFEGFSGKSTVDNLLNETESLKTQLTEKHDSQ